MLKNNKKNEIQLKFVVTIYRADFFTMYTPCVF